MRIEREDGYELLLEISNDLGGILLKMSDSEDRQKLILVYEKISKMLHNDKPSAEELYYNHLVKRRIKNFRHRNPEEAQKLESEIVAEIKESNRLDNWTAVNKYYPSPKQFEEDPDRAMFIQDVFERNGMKVRI